MLTLDDLKPGDVIRDTRKARTYRTVTLNPATGKTWTWKGLYCLKQNGTPDYLKHLAYWEKVN